MPQSSAIIIFLADYLIYFLPLGPLLAAYRRRYPRLIWESLAAAVLAWAMGFLIKNFYYLPRPFIFAAQLPLVQFHLDGSFPSNHTAVAFALSFPLLRYSRPAGLIMTFFSSLLASSRIMGGVHTLPDIVAGVILAAISSLAVRRLFRG